MDRLARDMTRALPFNASMGLNWSDSHIGLFLPARPPHFGFGVAAGFTTMDISPLADLLDIFGTGLSGQLSGFGDFLPFPGGVVEGRLGGLSLHFDLGFKVGTFAVPFGPFDDADDYFLIGGDIRLRMVEGNEYFLPTISLGVGINRLSGEMRRTVGNNVWIEYEEGDDTHILRIEDPNAGIIWSTTALDFKLQASWQGTLVIPYVGIGLSYGWSRVSSSLTARGGIFSTGDLWFAREALRAEDIDLDLYGNRFSNTVERAGFSPRLFGGMSFLLPFRLRLDLTGFWNFGDNFGVTAGIRVQF